MAAEVSYNNAWYTFGGAFSKKDVISKSYTLFWEQIGEATYGFGYNGEYYNAVTGMVYLSTIMTPAEKLVCLWVQRSLREFQA